MPRKDHAEDKPCLPDNLGELRTVCQQWKRDKDGKLVLAGSLYNRYVLRQISIHVTRCFIRFGIRANAATLLMTIAGLGGIVLNLPHVLPMTLVGGVLFFLFDLLDSVDGEIARWNKSSSTRGLYLDQVSHVLVDYPSCGVAALHYYFWTQDHLYLWLGIAAAVSSIMLRSIRDIHVRINAEASNQMGERPVGESLATKKGLFPMLCRQLKKVPLFDFPFMKPRLVHNSTIVGILLTYWGVELPLICLGWFYAVYCTIRFLIELLYFFWVGVVDIPHTKQVKEYKWPV